MVHRKSLSKYLSEVVLDDSLVGLWDLGRVAVFQKPVWFKRVGELILRHMAEASLNILLINMETYGPVSN